MVEAYKRFLRNYVNFNGRSTVSDYWWIILANFLIGFALGFVGGLLNIEGITSLISSLYSIAIIIPGIALVIRRLHDTNRSGWWFFISFVPIVGVIILIVFFCSPSVNENNKYGPIAE